MSARLRCLGILAALLPAALLPGTLLAEKPALTTRTDLRLRWEGWDAPSGNRQLDEAFSFLNLRARIGVDAKWERFELHGQVQGVAALDLPEAGSFGIGPTYVQANDGETDLEALHLVEANAVYSRKDLRIVLGRQPFMDGDETKTGIAYLDGIKKRRLAERLIGTWEWPNVGRRFDGLTVAAQTAGPHLTGFILRPLGGGVDYDDGFEPLDDFTIFGATLTANYGSWLPRGEVRLFALQSNDARPGARAAAGSDVDVTTAGASLLLGNDRNDVLLWVAAQRGDWGPLDQKAWAMIAEAGHRFTVGSRDWTLRGGLAVASGDDASTSAHETFFNLVPTNHKWYGTMDFSAFQNLRDIYVELLYSGHPRWNGRLGLNSFALVERSDAWYGGSGAFNETSLGFAARRPPGGFTSARLGTEVDLDLVFKLPLGFGLGVGGGYFAGAEGSRQVLSVEDDGIWTYLQLTWSR